MKKNRIKLFVIFGVEFVAIAIVLLLIFFAGKKSYTVTFDLDGGILLSGDLVQEVRQGGSATPPNAAKDGCFLHSWSASYSQVTKDMLIRAVWEYETTEGIVYTADEDGLDSNYCEIEGSFEHLRGDVYLGAYHNDKKVLGVRERAFYARTGIENIYMLDGILSIGREAFAGCTSLETITLPRTLAVISEGAFRNCTSLKTITIPATVEYIDAEAFAGCTSLEQIVFATEERSEADGKDAPATGNTYTFSALEIIGDRAFAGCTSLREIKMAMNLRQIGGGAFAGCISLYKVAFTKSIAVIGAGAFDNPGMIINIPIKASERPGGWASGWCASGVALIWADTELGG